MSAYNIVCCISLGILSLLVGVSIALFFLFLDDRRFNKKDDHRNLN